MPSLASAVHAFVRRHALAAPGDRLVAAVSGGSDSVALARLLLVIAPRAGWTVAGLVHVNHGLRGDVSNEDEQFCRACAAEWGLPIHVVRADVAANARARRRSIEAAGRDVRYAAFEEARRAFDAASVATGHTLDDQAETVLLRLLRGAGSRGLAGIRVRRGRVVRPLLGARRASLRAWLADLGQPFREDATNADVGIPRNRVRHELLPVLEGVAPRIVAALGRTAALSADDDSFLEAAAIEAAAGIVLSAGTAGHLTAVEMDAAGLSRLPLALGRRVVRRAAESLAFQAWSEPHVGDVIRLAARGDRGAGPVHLPGGTARREGGRLILQPGDLEPDPPPFDYPLAVPGRVAVPEAGVTIEAAFGAGPGAVSGTTVAVSKEYVRLPLRVRGRRPGDRFRPAGAPGSRKLQDVFVDRKIPRRERDRVPIVVDGSGRIVWVVGVAMAEGCRVTAPEAGVVTLKSIPLVGER